MRRETKKGTNIQSGMAHLQKKKKKMTKQEKMKADALREASIGSVQEGREAREDLRVSRETRFFHQHAAGPAEARWKWMGPAAPRRGP